MSSFLLNKLPINLPELEVKEIQEARILLSKYDGMITLLESPEVITDILGLSESVQSSSIEGTVATISDLLDFRVERLTDQRKLLEIPEIDNYKKTLQYAVEEAERTDYLFSKRLFKELQYQLLNNDRGEDKLRGEFKKEQNYIGNKFDKSISYTPVSPLLTNDYMENLVEYINDQEQSSFNPLVRIAIIHAQFELIHPFEDGNGRVGRIMIPLLLRKYKVLETSYFYISYYLSKNRDLYINSLEAISKDRNWQLWIRFFIKAVHEQSKMLISLLKELNSLRQETKEKIAKLQTTFGLQVVDFLFKKVKFTTRYFINKTGINENTARSLLKGMEKEGIVSLVEVGSGKRSSIYKFDAMYKIIQELDK